MIAKDENLEEMSMKLNLEAFTKQVERRLEEDYVQVIVVVIKQKERYEKKLRKIKDSLVVRSSELRTITNQPSKYFYGVRAES